MPNTDALERRGDAQWELVWLADGIDIGFCSHRALEGMDTGDGRVLRRGLIRDDMRRRLEIDMRRGELVPHTMRVHLHDDVGDLAFLFASERDDFEYLDTTIRPSDDLFLRTNLHGMHVGTERIGPLGERRQYPVPLGNTTGGLHFAHPPDGQLGLASAPVSEHPMIWRGRRCALYRVYRDHIEHPDDYSQGWRPVSEWRRIWWGTMTDDGSVQGRRWVIECAGPESWLQRDLGVLTQTRPVSVHPLFEYAEEEAYAAGIIQLSTNESHGVVDFAPLFTGDTLDELRLEFASFLQELASAPGDAGAWDSYDGNVLAPGGQGRSILMRHGEAAPPSLSATMILALHRSMWQRLGWDLEQVTSTDEYEFSFLGEQPLFSLTMGVPPSSGYVFLRLKIDQRDTPIIEVEPRFPGGIAPLDPLRINASGQVLNLSALQTGEVTHQGQLHAPVASDPNEPSLGYDLPDSTRCDTQGFWLIEGKRRYTGTEEEFDESVVVQCSWADSQGTVLNNQVVATRQWDPRFFGISRAGLASTWSAQVGGFTARPLLYFGYRQTSGYDRAHLVMQRLLLSTGTSEGWSGFAAEAPITIDPGDNDPPILAGFVRLDTEVADLGLAIPRDMVASPAEFLAAAQSATDEALEVFAAYAPGVNSEDIFRGLMRPLGFAWSLAGGRYGIFTPHDPIAEPEIRWALNRATQDAPYGRLRPPKVDQREYAPVDAFKMQWSAVVYRDEFRYDGTVDAGDAGRRYRSGGIEEEVDAPSHRRANTASEGLRARQSARAAFWAKRHYTVRDFDVLPSLGRRIWPGDGARVSHPLLVDPSAADYGVASRRARVTAVTEDFSRSRGGISVDFLAYAERSSRPHVMGPIAHGTGYDRDERAILVDDDFLGLGNGWMDVRAFIEPEYVGLEPLGGQLDIQWRQNDGSGWAQTGRGRVESIDDTPGAARIILAAGSLVGVYYPCQDSIVTAARVDQQTAPWGQALFVGIAGPDGQTSLGPNPRFEDV